MNPSRADRVGADEHPLEDRVGVALKDCAVHVRARLTLVGVAHDVLDVGFGLASQPPLLPGGNAAPPRPRSPERTISSITSSGFIRPMPRARRGKYRGQSSRPRTRDRSSRRCGG